jgi:purine-binding chemotaxis protein CheW
VQDVVPEQDLTRIPKSHRSLAGLLNLRGQIVTAIDLRSCLDVGPGGASQSRMNIVVLDRGEHFSLVVDSVGDVLSVDTDRIEPPPGTLHAKIRNVCGGVCRLEEGLVLIVNIPSVLELGSSEPRRSESKIANHKGEIA